MKVCIRLLWTLLWSFTASANQWFYPIAQQADGTLLLLHQQSSSKTHLFSWDPETGVLQSALSSRHNPVGVTIIPGSSTFSFIDNGRIRIQEATKRSAYALDVKIPLYAIGPVSWTSQGKGFFSAKAQGDHAIYCTDLLGNVTRVAGPPGVDCLYPSCTDTGLFYITRRVDDRVAPRCPKHAQCRCRPIDPVDVFIYSINVVGYGIINENDGRVLVRELCPLAFLTMVSDTQGFVLEYDPVLQEDALNITMRCHRFFKDTSNSWALSYLFSYTIPLSLIKPGSATRLCEGLLPFVPRHKAGTLYFVDCKGGGLGVYSYSMDGGEVTEEVAPSAGSLYCAPLPITTSQGNYLIYGGIIQGEPSTEQTHFKVL